MKNNNVITDSENDEKKISKSHEKSNSLGTSKIYYTLRKVQIDEQ